MPDSLGRYFLGADMEPRVRRLLDALNLTLDANGNETASTIVNFLISNTDIDFQINEALVALYSEAILAHEDLFAIDLYMDIKAGQLQYAFPPNMIQLRWMRWKDPSLLPPSQAVVGASSQIVAHPYDYTEMVEVSDPVDLGMSVDTYRAPTYRRVGDAFTLGDYPTQDNKQGILMNIVALPPALILSTAATPSTSVIQGLFARVAQEVIIYDAAYTLAMSKNKQVGPEITTKREEWHQRFMTMVQNAYHALSISMTSSALIGDNYAGRRRSRGFNRSTTW